MKWYAQDKSKIADPSVHQQKFPWKHQMSSKSFSLMAIHRDAFSNLNSVGEEKSKAGSTSPQGLVDGMVTGIIRANLSYGAVNGLGVHIQLAEYEGRKEHTSPVLLTSRRAVLLIYSCSCAKTSILTLPEMHLSQGCLAAQQVSRTSTY
ncbi:Sorting Nexin-20 [Manis pentadactyla]|nr:Sorting Nexin-20 [Manis pentadactyla]